jgi:tRNA A37 threonylcarbamoyladenosine modification protein TsaB
MFLFLDKTVEQIKILIVDGVGKIIKRKVAKGKKDILPAISEIIKNQKIFGIVAVAGPDSFSISRGKVSIANTLSFAWDIPVAGLGRSEFFGEKDMVKKGLELIKKTKAGRMIFPVYDREPNITVK